MKDTSTTWFRRRPGYPGYFRYVVLDLSGSIAYGARYHQAENRYPLILPRAKEKLPHRDRRWAGAGTLGRVVAEELERRTSAHSVAESRLAEHRKGQSRVLWWF
jgi:hypothetical protein